MLKRPMAACALVALAITVLPAAPRSAAAPRAKAARTTSTALPAGFAQTLVADGLNSPVAMAVAPDGRVFIAEQGGALRVVENDALVAAPVLTVETTANSELGLVGVAVPPRFPADPFVYVTRTTDQPARHNQIVRYKVSGNAGIPDSAGVVADLDNLAATDRVAGALRFGPDGMLYAATGDNTDGMKAQDLASTHGKLLRFGADGEIPPDNPFAGQSSGRYRAIWASGLRNPFTFAFQPGSGRLFINDVGASGFEEINEGSAGANYGWPMTEGPTAQPGFTTPLFAYSHARGCAIQGGAFYSPADEADAPFPADYTDLYFFTDYCTGEIRTIDPDLVGDFTVFGTAGAPGPVDLALAPDGGLYNLVRGSTAPHGGSGPSFSTGQLYKIRYVGTGRPTISSPPADTTVSTGMTARFTVRASGAPPLGYRWQRDGVDIPGATARDLTIGPVQLTDDGAQISVIVTNGDGSATAGPARLTVVNRRPPAAAFDLPTPGFRFRNGSLVTFAGHAVDPEDGPLPPSALTWRIDLHQGGNVYPIMPALGGVGGGSHMVDVDAHPQGDGFLRIELRATDSDGQTTTITRDVPPDLVDLTILTEPAGLGVVLDSQPVTGPVTVPSIVGSHRTVAAPALQTVDGAVYAFENWSDGGEAVHPVTIALTPLTLTARYRLFSGSVGIVDWGGDYVDADAGLRGADGPVDSKIDIDRDGLYNDQRLTIPLSDLTPLSPAASRHGSSWRFYGGLILESYNRPFDYRLAQIWAESAVKPNDKLYYGASPGTIGWDLRYWKKEDFLGEGSARQVVLDESSKIELINYEGGDGVPQNNSGMVRIVVKDGEQWFISKSAGLPATASATFVLRTLRSELWAQYDPQSPNRIRFKPAIAIFEPHVFRDVQAVGYLHSNDNNAPPAADVRAGFTVERVRVSARLGDPATPRPSTDPSATPGTPPTQGTPATATPVVTPSATRTATIGPSPTATRTLRPGETPPPTDTPVVLPSDTPPPGATTARPSSTATRTFTPTRTSTTPGSGGAIYLPISAKTSAVGGRLAGRAGRPATTGSVERALAPDDRQRALVVLRTDADVARNDVGDAATMAAVAAVQDAVLAAVDADDVALRHRYEIVPILLVDATARGRAALRRDPRVVAVEPDRVSRPLLAEHARVVRADVAWRDYGVTGEGVNVAVIDTGVDADHPDLKDAIIAQKCFSVDSGCGVNGAASESDDAIDRNGHGTGVAGIVASRGHVAAKGIAPGAGIVAVRVFNAAAQSNSSDQIKAFDWIVRERRNLNVKIANMSLGSAETFSGNCDSTDQARTTAIQTAVTRGIAVFVATGNSGAQNRLSSPGCLSNVIAVAATYDADLGREPDAGEFGVGCFDANASPDVVACFSNIGRGVSLVAPGIWTTTDAPGGKLVTTAGTSNAAPVAAAVGALVLSVDDSLRPADLQRLLEETGTLVTAKNGQKYPRVDAVAALIKAGAKPATPVGPTQVPTTAATASPTPKPTPTVPPSATTIPTTAPTSTPPADTPSPTRTGVPASATSTATHPIDPGPTIYLPVAANRGG